MMKRMIMMKMKTMMVMMMMKGVLAQKRVCQKGAQGLDYKRGVTHSPDILSLFPCKSDEDFIPTDLKPSS